MINKKAFSFIEIIVTISILVIVSSSGILYFFDFTNNQEIKIHTQNIVYNLKSLDLEILNKNSLDYRATFNTMTGYLLYTIDKNYSFNSNPTVINSLENSGSGQLSILSGSGADIWNVKVYSGKKLTFNDILQADSTYDFFLTQNDSYTIKSYINGVENNSVILKYYAETNTKNKTDGLLLESINTKEDGTGTNIEILEVINVGGNKKIYGDGSKLSQAYLFFELQGQTHTLLIK